MIYNKYLLLYLAKLFAIICFFIVTGATVTQAKQSNAAQSERICLSSSNRSMVSVPGKEREQNSFPRYDVRNYKSLSKALDMLGKKKAFLLIPDKQIVQGRLSIPANIILLFKNSGVINISRDAELIINGPIQAGRKQIFSGPGATIIYGGASRKAFPEWWGAKRDGKSDDTKPVQAAITSLSAGGGGKIEFAEGMYIVDSISLDSNVTIAGRGRKSIIAQKKNSQYCFSINPGNGGTADFHDNKRNIKMYNIHFLGTVLEDGFSEHVHLLNINAATDVIISNCWITGWRGDGIYLGSSNLAQTERHNRNIIIKDCHFDGLNNNNRNAITIKDCNGLEILNNSFTRSTRRDMPGAVDIEPSPNSFTVLRDISIIGNSFSQIGGGVGILSVVLPLKQKEMATPSRNIIISNNNIDGVIGSGRSHGINIMQNQGASEAESPNDISITGNVVKNTTRPFIFWGVKGVTITGNLFEDSLYTGFVSYINDHVSRNVMFNRNTFKDLGTDEGSGITVFTAEDISFVDNIFENVGMSKDKYGVAINLSRGVVERLRIENNKFKSRRATRAILMNRNRINNDELLIQIKSNNSFETGIKPVSYQ